MTYNSGIFVLFGAALETCIEDGLAFIGGSRLKRCKVLLVVATLGADAFHDWSVRRKGATLSRNRIAFVELYSGEGAQSIEYTGFYLQVTDRAHHVSSIVQVGGQWQDRTTACAKIHLVAGLGVHGEKI